MREIQGRRPAALRPIPRQTLDDAIAVEVRRRIISLHYRPGTMLSENAIAGEFGVSRTPAHYAFLQLAREGLLRILPQRGAEVTFLSRAAIADAQYIRECLEAAAFADAARKFDPTNPAHQAWEGRLRTILAEQLATIEAGDGVGFLEKDAAFHSTVLDLLGRELLTATVNQMRDRLIRVRYVEYMEARHEREAYRDHVGLLERLLAKDARGARRHLVAHLKMLEKERDRMLARHPEFFEETGDAWEQTGNA
jgi:DNA-binding GntR family transcriptional regulator